MRYITYSLGATIFSAMPFVGLANGGETNDYGHMMFGSHVAWSWFGSLGMIIWLVVGALLIAWLWKQINKK